MGFLPTFGYRLTVKTQGFGPWNGSSNLPTRSMQIPNRRIHKMIAELREIADNIRYEDFASANRLEGMAAYFEGNFKSRPEQKAKS